MITLDQVIEVKRQFRYSTQNCFMCHGSRLFDELWSEDQKPIRILGELFLQTIPNTEWTVSDYALFTKFIKDSYTTDKEDRAIRFKFLNWWISKLQNESIPS